MALYEESISGIKEGQIVKGTVVSIGPSEVMVDIGFKSEGVVPIKEFSDPESIEKGQEIEVFLEDVEDQEGPSRTLQAEGRFHAGLGFDQGGPRHRQHRRRAG